MKPRWRVLGGPWEGGTVAGRILARRGLLPQDEIHHDPFLMKDMEIAVERLRRALRDQERILVFGDYDADGVTSSALLRQGLTELGGRVGVRLPHRVEEGYGLQAGQMRQILEGNADLLVTADNGTSAHEALALAAADGLDTLVVDHHVPTSERVPALAVLNPSQADCGYPFKSLAAVGVAWKLLQALGWCGRSPEDPRGLDLAALGTVADMARLTGENRLLVTKGLRELGRAPRPGLAALLELPGVRTPGGVDARTLGWQLGPRINCAGRLASAELALELLCAPDRASATPLALRLDALNQERRRVQDEAVGRAEKALDGAEDLPAVLIFVGADWHLGVIGLIAGRLSQRWDRPVVILTRVLGNGVVKGSARSVPGLHITEAIARQRELLVEFGGHAEAAGLTLREEHLKAFMERLADDIEERLPARPAPELLIDSAVDPLELDLALPGQLAALEPCGMGNPPAKLALTGARIERLFSLSGGKHLKLWLGAGGRRFEAVWWRHSEPDARYGDAVDIAFTPQLNQWNGKTELQLEVEDIRPAEPVGAAHA